MNKEKREQLHKQFLINPLSRRLGALAATLIKISSLALRGTKSEDLIELLNEASYFIEWIVTDAEQPTAKELGEIQTRLAFWQKTWEEASYYQDRRILLSVEAKEWSDEVLIFAGLANSSNLYTSYQTDELFALLDNTDKMDKTREKSATLKFSYMTPEEKAKERIAKVLQTNASELKLSWMQLTSLPAEISQLTKLNSLSVYVNLLTNLPKEIGDLGNLTLLDISDNRLVSLPTEIGHLVNLKHLNLSGNKLEALPIEILKLTKLEYLDLRENLLPVPP